MRETITAALKAATKAQDKRRISTLRLVAAAIKDRDIAARVLGKNEATDAELLELFAKMIKQREESEKIYADAGRVELAKQEAEEIAIIREFLPKPMIPRVSVAPATPRARQRSTIAAARFLPCQVSWLPT